MTNLEMFFTILGLLIASIGVYYTYKAFKKKPESTSKTTQVTIGTGDSVAGDKVGGDKVGGDKIVYTTKEDK